MRIAVPVWDGQVSPVFDVARRVEVYESHGNAIGTVSTHRLHEAHAASDLADLGVELLICSAISAELETVLWISGIEVLSEICGDADRIVATYLGGDHDLQQFRSPAKRPRHDADGRPPAAPERSNHRPR
jgi:predicted Fe-Mo cluster-binding NifX family protein